MPESESSIDIDKTYSEIRRIVEDFKKLQKTVKEQQDTITSQTGEIDELRQCLETEIIKMIYTNEEITKNMIRIVKEANKFIIIFTNQISPDLKESEELNDLFDAIKNKLDSKGVRKIIIRYRSYHDLREDGETTKQKIERRLGGVRSILDLKSMDIHLRLLITEKECLIFSNNLTPYSFKDQCKEIGTLITSPVILADIRSNIAKRYNLEIPS